jgi:hypothetical protein
VKEDKLESKLLHHHHHILLVLMTLLEGQSTQMAATLHAAAGCNEHEQFAGPTVIPIQGHPTKAVQCTAIITKIKIFYLHITHDKKINAKCLNCPNHGSTCICSHLDVKGCPPCPNYPSE